MSKFRFTGWIRNSLLFGVMLSGCLIVGALFYDSQQVWLRMVMLIAFGAVALKCIYLLSYCVEINDRDLTYGCFFWRRSLAWAEIIELDVLRLMEVRARVPIGRIRVFPCPAEAKEQILLRYMTETNGQGRVKGGAKNE